MAARWHALLFTQDEPTASRQVVSIQYLRVIAAVMVMIFHIAGQLKRLGYTGDWPEWTARGVDIFFVISGFVMWLTARSRPTTTAKFYWNRVIRIVPLYWILTSFIVVMMLELPSLVQSGQFDLHQMIMSYLFLPSVQPNGSMYMPVLEPGWTLNYEMYFYFVFGALLFLPDRRLLWAVAIWLVGTVALGTMGSHSNPFVQFYGSSIILDFGFGLGLAAAFVRGWVLPSALSWVLIPACFLQLSLAGFVPAPHWVTNGLPALGIVAGAVALERRHGIRKVWLLLLLGDASYSLYLSHGIVLSACLQITKKLGLDDMPGIIPLFFVGGCAVAVAVALLIHTGFESRLLNKRRAVKTASPSSDRLSSDQPGALNPG